MSNPIQRALLVSLLTCASAFCFTPITEAADTRTAKKSAAKKEIQKPKKGKIATAPPPGATLVKGWSLPKGLKWKTDKETKSVFAVTTGKNKQRDVWFIDPDTGWAYTVDAAGSVFVVNPKTGQVYSRGTLISWVGDLLYFFSFWDVESSGSKGAKAGKGSKTAKGGTAGKAAKGKSLSMPKADRFVAIYEDPRVVSYDATAAYTEVWTYEEYFESTEFVETYEPYVEEYEEEIETVAGDDTDDSAGAGEAEVAGEDAGDEEVADEEVADEEVADEEVADEEVADDEAVDEEVADEEAADEDVGDEEAADEPEDAGYDDDSGEEEYGGEEE